MMTSSRRAVLAIAGTALLCSRAVLAQEAGRTYRIGILAGVARQAPHWVAFFDELSKAGFVEGKNLIVDWRFIVFRSEQNAALVAELVQLAPDLISCGGKENTGIVQAATRTIPLVGTDDDMVGSGLVPSLARPGGNLTGISFMATELDGKRLEILMELVPVSRHVAALADPTSTGRPQLDALQGAATSRGVELSIYPVHGPEEIAAALD